MDDEHAWIQDTVNIQAFLHIMTNPLLFRILLVQDGADKMIRRQLHAFPDSQRMNLIGKFLIFGILFRIHLLIPIRIERMNT